METLLIIGFLIVFSAMGLTLPRPMV